MCQTIRSSFLDCAFHMLQRDAKHSCFFRDISRTVILSGMPCFSVILNYLCLLAAKNETMYPQKNILDLFRQNTEKDSLKLSLHLFTSKYVNYCISFRCITEQYFCMYVVVVVQSLSCVWLFATPWTVAHQNPLSMGISQAGILESVSCSVVSESLWLHGSCVHGISQARILESVACSFSRGTSRLRDRTHVSYIDRQILYHWATREAFLNVYKYIYIYIFFLLFNVDTLHFENTSVEHLTVIMPGSYNPNSELIHLVHCLLCLWPVLSPLYLGSSCMSPELIIWVGWVGASMYFPPLRSVLFLWL